MSNKKHISLILAIMMVLQLIVPQVPLQAKSSTGAVQRSERQKIGKRSEIFEFKNTEKERPSWFTMRTQSLFGARDVGLTKSEKVKIETAVKGLDEGAKQFNWEAFGQNKKFEAWVEVAYVGEKDKQGNPVRHKVSEDFEINAAGTINTNIVVDASKTVENYYIVTEYDKDPDSFKINAFFQKTTIVSDKGEKSIAFKLEVQQIVSTKITYNLIDEYGKAIDLKDAKEEKPEDKDLKGIGKIGDVISFDLKKDGTEILWQDKKLDEFNLTDSSLKMTLTKDKITSAGIDYKLTSTYDVINGGKVTIQRQKDAVTPKDPKNPGEIPAGYARINLVADETGNGSKGTFTKDSPQDTQRVVDVKAGKPYTVAKPEIEKQGKPFPLTSEKKVDTGKTFKAWAPELSTLGTAADKDTKTLNATYESSKVEIIPYLPTDPVPDKDKDGLPIPSNYVIVTFKSESETKGKVKIGDKEGATVLAKVKPGIDLSQKAEITTVPEQHYGFTKWDPTLTKAAAGQTYTAYFVKSGEEIGEKDPIPAGWFKVTVSQDDDSIVANTVKKAVYPVEPNGKLAADKFADLKNKANAGYKDPAWYVGSDKVEKPYEVVINSSMDFVARATELESHKITKDNGLKPVDFTAYKDDEMGKDFWKKGVELKKPDENLQKLLDAANVTDATTPARTTAEAGEKTGTLKVTFSDGSFIEVQNQKLTVIDTKVEIDYDKESDKDANAPRHNDEVVKGKIKSDEALEGAKVEILDKDNKVIGITLAKADGSFIAGTRKLQAGETIKVRVTLPKAGKASEPVEKTVKLNADRLKDLLPIAKAQKDNFSKKQNAIIKAKLEALGTAITEAEKLVDEKGKAKGEDTAKNQTAIDNAVTNLENALKALTANIPPTISGPKTHEIFVGEALDLKALVDVTDGDGADDLVEVDGSKVQVKAVKVEKATEPNGADKETPVTDLSTIKNTVGNYKVTYTAGDKAGAKVTHEMTLTVKSRTNSAIEVTTDPTTMKYLITKKGDKAKLNLEGMTLNLVDNLGKKTPVQLTDKNVTFKVNGKEIKDGGDLTLADDVQFIEVEYKDGDRTLTAKTNGVLRVGPDYDNDGTDDRTQNFDPKNIEKLEVIKQPQLDYIAKDKSEDSKFKLNLEGMIVRMTDKAGKEKLAVVKDGKFKDYDDQEKEITVLTATPAHGAKLTPQTSDTDKGHNGSKVAITGPNNSKAETDPLKVFYDANGDKTPDYEQGQKTPAPSAMARNIGKDAKVTTVEGMATPGAVIKITDKDGKVLTTEPEKVVAGPDGKYKATISPKLDDGTEIKVTAKLGEMGESDKTPTKVFDDKNNNKQPDKDEGFNIAKATKIEFVDQPDLTYLVKTKETEVTFNGKDGKGKAIYLKLSYQDGEKTESKIMTLEDLMKDEYKDSISVTPANGTKTTYNNQYDTEGKAKQDATLVGKNLIVTLKKVLDAENAKEEDKRDKTAITNATAISKNKFAIEIDADGNGKADKDETTETPTVTARNIGENPQKTTVEIETKPNAKVTIEYTDKDGQLKKIENLTAGVDGKLTQEITPALKAGTEVKVTVQDGEKKPTDKTVKVFEDINDDKKPDTQTERPAAIASNKGTNNGATPTFTTIEGTTEKGAVITVTVKVNGEEKPVTVENLKVNDDGTYTLEAKYHNKPLDNGAEILVYAKNAPKTKSKPQTTTVFDDFNNDGKPDGGKVDLKDIKDIQVISPKKTSYTQGDKLDPTGLKVVVRDNKGGIEIFEYDQKTGGFIDKNGKPETAIKATVNKEAIATVKVEGEKTTVETLPLTKEKHDGKAIDVKVGDKNGSTEKVLEVKQLQTPTPTIEFAANQNTIGTDGTTPTQTAKQKTTVKFTVKNKPTTVYVKYTDNGAAKEESFEIKENDDATKTVDLQVKLPVGAEVQVLAKDADKALSEAATAKVVRDANNDGQDDGKKALKEPVIEDIKAGAVNITVTPPEGATKLVISETDKNGKTPEGSKPITVTKDPADGKWKIGETPVKEEAGKLIIPNPEDDNKLKLDEYNVVKVDAEGDPDTTTPSTATKTVGKAADKTPPAKPVVDQPVDGDENIKVKTPTEPDAKTITVKVTRPAEPVAPGEKPGDPTVETIVVTKDGDGNWKTPDKKEVSEVNGKLEIPVKTNKPMKTGDTVTVTTTDDSGNPSKANEQPVVAKIKMDKPKINPIKTGDRTVEGTALTNEGTPEQFAASTVDIYKYEPPTEEGKEGTWKLLAKNLPVDQKTGAYKYNNDEAFKDGDKIRVVAKKPGAEDSFDEITAGVDTTALDNAIKDGNEALDPKKGGSDNNTPEDNALKDAIKNGETEKNKKPPTQDGVDKAKEAIEKAIDDKKKADEARDKLQEKISEANNKKNDKDYPTKPDDVKKELDDAAKEGQKVHDNNNKSKEDIDKEIKKIQEKIDQYNKQQIGVNIRKVTSNDKTVVVTVTASNAKVEVFKSELSYGTWQTVLTPLGEATSITRLLIVSLDEALPSGTNLFIKVTHPDYLSYESNVTVE